MPVVCIGPVCIPVWHLWALGAFLIKPCVSWLRRICKRSPKDETENITLQGGKKKSSISSNSNASASTVEDGTAGSKDSHIICGTSRVRLQKERTVRRSSLTANNSVAEVSNEDEWVSLLLKALSNPPQQTSSILQDAPSTLNEQSNSCLPLEIKVFVDFSAEWCDPCKRLYPVYEKLCEFYCGDFILRRGVGENTEFRDGVSSIGSSKDFDKTLHNGSTAGHRENNTFLDSMIKRLNPSGTRVERSRSSGFFSGSASFSSNSVSSALSRVIFVTVDVDDYEQLATMADVSVLPTIVMYEPKDIYLNYAESNVGSILNNWVIGDKIVGPTAIELEKFIRDKCA